MQPATTRREFLGNSVAVSAALALASSAAAADPSSSTAAPTSSQPAETYETHAKGIRILPGEWRPHYPWEQIVWISPSWPSQDYLWLDFPEAIFTNQGLLFLSHVNPPLPAVFADLPKVPWQEIPGGLAFERTLPNGVSFGGKVVRDGDQVADLELHLRNGSGKELKDITLQTCAFLRGIREFADYTRDNKFVHVTGQGWTPIAKAMTMEEEKGKYRVGWRMKGKAVADLPVAVTLSNKGSRLMAMTWLDDTLSLVSNPNHPCVHADPQFKDLAPDEEASIRGKIIFFEGELEEFDFAKYL
jgi:hypothetical protein